jgi:predicted  nucleic acid-binding Zn-ribbon protein
MSNEAKNGNEPLVTLESLFAAHDRLEDELESCKDALKIVKDSSAAAADEVEAAQIAVLQLVGAIRKASGESAGVSGQAKKTRGAA